MDEERANPGELRMDRFNGRETYRITWARWNLYEDESAGWMNLWLEVWCGEAIAQAEDTAYLGGSPSWELNFIGEELSDLALVPGFRQEIPRGYDKTREGWITNFHFCEHDGSDANTLAVLDRDGDRLLLRLTGEVIDVNYYDDSKPRSKLLVETWFEKYPDGRRSMD